jgi:hypothetical protein
LYNIQDEESKEQEKDSAKSESVYINASSMLEKELGYWEMRAAENEFLKEEMSKMNKEKLNKSDLQSLDRR